MNDATVCARLLKEQVPYPAYPSLPSILFFPRVLSANLFAYRMSQLGSVSDSHYSSVASRRTAPSSGPAPSASTSHRPSIGSMPPPAAGGAAHRPSLVAPVEQEEDRSLSLTNVNVAVAFTAHPVVSLSAMVPFYNSRRNDPHFNAVQTFKSAVHAVKAIKRLKATLDGVAGDRGRLRADTFVCTGHVLGNIHVWNAETFEHVKMGTHWNGATVQSITVANTVIYTIVSRQAGGHGAPSDGTVIYMWDIVTMALRHCLEGHSDNVTCLAVDESNEFSLVSASADKTICRWDTHRQPLATIAPIQQFAAKGVVTQMVVTPRLSFACTGTSDGYLRWMDLSRGEVLATSDSHTSHITFMKWHTVFAPPLVSADAEGGVNSTTASKAGGAAANGTCDTHGVIITACLGGHVKAFRVSAPDVATTASGSASSLSQSSSQSAAHTLIQMWSNRSHKASVSDVCWDEAFVMSCSSADPCVVFYHTETYKTQRFHVAEGGLRTLSCDPTRKALIVGCDSGQLVVLNYGGMSTAEGMASFGQDGTGNVFVAASFHPHLASVAGVVIDRSQHGTWERIITGARDGSLCILDCDLDRDSKSYRCGTTSQYGGGDMIVAFPSNEFIAQQSPSEVSVSAGGPMVETSAGQFRRASSVVAHPSTAVATAGGSSSPSRPAPIPQLLLTANDAEFTLFDAASMELRPTFSKSKPDGGLIPHDGRITTLRYDAEGAKLITGGYDGACRVYSCGGSFGHHDAGAAGMELFFTLDGPIDVSSVGGGGPGSQAVTCSSDAVNGVIAVGLQRRHPTYSKQGAIVVYDIDTRAPIGGPNEAAWAVQTATYPCFIVLMTDIAPDVPSGGGSSGTAATVGFKPDHRKRQPAPGSTAPEETFVVIAQLRSGEIISYHGSLSNGTKALVPIRTLFEAVIPNFAVELDATTLCPLPFHAWVNPECNPIGCNMILNADSTNRSVREATYLPLAFSAQQSSKGGLSGGSGQGALTVHHVHRFEFDVVASCRVQSSGVKFAVGLEDSSAHLIGEATGLVEYIVRYDGSVLDIRQQRAAGPGKQAPPSRCLHKLSVEAAISSGHYFPAVSTLRADAHGRLLAIGYRDGLYQLADLVSRCVIRRVHSAGTPLAGFYILPSSGRLVSWTKAGTLRFDPLLHRYVRPVREAGPTKPVSRGGTPSHEHHLGM